MLSSLQALACTAIGRVRVPAVRCQRPTETNMDKRSSAVALSVGLAILLVTAGSGRPAAQRETPSSAPQAPSAPPSPPPPAQQPTFRAGINFVRVDVIVTDRQGNAVADLRQEDFEVTEDGRPQKIESFKLVNVTSGASPADEAPRDIRTSIDEESEASRDDVRLFAVFLDDYHVRRETSWRVREPLAAFVENQLRPLDMVGAMYPLTPVSDLLLTHNRDAVAGAIRRFEGRKYDYKPRNLFEEKYSQYPTAVAEQIRNQVTMSALKALVIHLGGLREGRKAVIFVSEGFASTLPAGMQDPNASVPGVGTPTQAGAVGRQSSMQTSADFFANTALQSDLREVTDAANRNNTTIYTVDPRGLANFEFGLDRNVSPESDRAVLNSTMDTLRQLADDTDGRAIVNQNDLDRGLRQVVRDTSAYYLLGYSSIQAPADGKFHEIKVRVRRPGIDVRARRGYWALTAEEMTRALAPPRPAPPSAVQTALAALDTTARGRAIRTWVGMAPGEGGRTRVTFVWEPIPPAPGARGDTPDRVRLVARGPDGEPYFRGEVSGAARAEFDAAPGTIEMLLSVEDAGAQVIDRDVREIAVADFGRAAVTLSTPEVFRARTARDWQALSTDPNAVPVPGREFRRAERLLIRFGAYGPGGSVPAVSARVLNRTGQPILTLPVAPAGGPGRLQQVDLPLAGLAVGDYLVELKASGEAAEATELVPLRVTGS
jgi:VWFA-related protein